MSDSVRLELTTQRLLLRQWREQDAEPMAQINRDPQVTRLLNRPTDARAVAAFHQATLDHWSEHGYGLWAVESRESELGSGVIGFVGAALPTFIHELAARPELGWRLASDCWGRGLATEAARAARAEPLGPAAGLDELISIIHPDNVRSQSVARKLSMQVEREVHNPVINRQVQVWVTEPSDEA
ncbi:MAG: GNAT family N-acetyltransferase [Solirubrobacteraceae bacterium]